jgi:hypothetical protein
MKKFGLSEIQSKAILGENTTLSQNVREFLQLQDWFPQRPQLPSAKNTFKVNEYWLSIPKLSIQNAKVTVRGDDLATKFYLALQ